ncbi:sensor histidine kinase [Bacillus sp. REN16]|uniref:sensor histidine kinase n=1 Tax=Bacillus sp. REN16 TaxID=2887296 RepID=UPI001E4B872C|nr:sensor histidine kinase [Bacillus sp. REN16]MCC3355314.1 sensor histidine kinase [Bacillus sp. REN16]
MKNRRFHLKHNSLFLIMFFLTVISIISVAIIITWTTLRMAEDFFIDKFSITNAKVLDQVTDSFESFHYAIVTASNNLSQSGTLKTILTEEQTNAEKMNSYFNLRQLMKRVEPNLEAYDVSITVLGENGISYSTNRNYWPISDNELSESHLTASTKRHFKKLIYNYDQRENLNSKQMSPFVIATRALLERGSGNIYGVMYFAIREKEFRSFYTNYTSPGNDIFVIDGYGRIVSSNRDELIGQGDPVLQDYASELNKNPDKYVIKEFDGKAHIFFGQYLESFDLYILNVIDKDTAVSGLIDKKEMAVTLSVIIVVAILFVFLMSRRITNALYRLVREISNASKTNFHQYVSVNGTYETRELGQAFNSMLDELHDYVDQHVESQKKIRHAELAALQQQINPHFLYNTLTSIKFMVKHGSKAEAEETLNAFISILQNTIGNGSETVQVKQEVNTLKDYVFINQMRYGSRITVSYFVGANCEDYMIPKLILQPFLENAFFHGFNRKPDGSIKVLIWKQGVDLICEIVDNGDGMDLAEENELPVSNRKQDRFTGIGIRNVHERIQLLYGETYGVSITSEIGNGTKVRITLPVEKE